MWSDESLTIPIVLFDNWKGRCFVNETVAQ